MSKSFLSPPKDRLMRETEQSDVTVQPRGFRGAGFAAVNKPGEIVNDGNVT